MRGVTAGLVTAMVMAGCWTPPATPPDDVGAPEDEVTPATLLPRAATAICDAMARCCDAASQERYFAPWVALESLDDLDPLLPPATALSPQECPTLVEELLTRRPFGAWLQAVDRGLVDFKPQEAQACLTALQAPCGAEVAGALDDVTCFALGPPAGGTEQRRMFDRKTTQGPCVALDDGVGGLLYGTCDPLQAFCCAGTEACAFPSVGEDGRCVPVAGTDEVCSMAPLQLCATGESCGMDDRCHADVTAALALGDPCIDDNFALLGQCDGGYCDVLGAEVCTPLIAEGGPCDASDACATGLCSEGRCVQDVYCHR